MQWQQKEAQVPGNFFLYDLMTTDTKAAQKFYGDVIGWGAQDSGTPGVDYTLFTVNGQGVAGLMPIPEDARKTGARPSWMGYMSTKLRPDYSRKAGRFIGRPRMFQASSVIVSYP